MDGPFLRIIGRFKKYILFSAENQNLFSALLFSFLPRLLKIHFLRFFSIFCFDSRCSGGGTPRLLHKGESKTKKAFFIY